LGNRPRASRLDSGAIAVRPGPPRKLTEDEVLDAALSLLADQGLDGLNVRAVAARLDASPGTLYNYFDNKQSMVEAALARALSPVLLSIVRSGDWRADLRATMVALYDAMHAQPAAVVLISAGVGAATMDPIREHLLGLLADAGLSTSNRVRAQNMLVSLAVGDVIVHQAHMRAHRAVELDRRRGLPPDEFPYLREAALVQREEPGTETFLTGLDALLDAIADI
jgi:AcrR family transcriptional regulator